MTAPEKPGLSNEEFEGTLRSLNHEYNRVCICGKPYGSLYHEAGIYFQHEFVERQAAFASADKAEAEAERKEGKL